jgi:hypothetical protein
MNDGLKVSYLWHDNDVIEVRVASENAQFRGTADVYVSVGGLLDAATQLGGFPTNNLDRRELVFGALGKEFAGGFVRLEFYCTDGAGHAALRATIESDYGNRESAESAVVHVNFEPAALDVFLLQLQQIDKECSGSASLLSGF